MWICYIPRAHLHKMMAHTPNLRRMCCSNPLILLFSRTSHPDKFNLHKTHISFTFVAMEFRNRGLKVVIRYSAMQGKSLPDIFQYFHLASYPSVLIQLLHYGALPGVWIRWRGLAYYSRYYFWQSVSVRPNGKRSGCRFMCCVCNASIPFLGLPKLQQRGMEELWGYWPSLTRTLKRGQVFLFFLFGYSFTFPIPLFSPNGACIHFIHSQVAKDLNLYYSLYSNPFFVLIFKRNRLVFCM